MTHHEQPQFKAYIFVDKSGEVTTLDKRDITESTKERMARASSVIAVFEGGGIEVVKNRGGVR